MDHLQKIGNLIAAHDELSYCDFDHSPQARAKSDSKLIFNVAGYVDRNVCSEMQMWRVPKLPVYTKRSSFSLEASLTSPMTMGLILYPSNVLNQLVSSLEDTFTHCFSVKQLRINSLTDFALFLQIRPPALIGCDKHKRDLTNQIVKCYAITRLQFLVKGKIVIRECARQGQTLLKMRHVLWSSCDVLFTNLLSE